MWPYESYTICLKWRKKRNENLCNGQLLWNFISSIDLIQRTISSTHWHIYFKFDVRLKILFFLQFLIINAFVVGKCKHFTCFNVQWLKYFVSLKLSIGWMNKFWFILATKSNQLPYYMNAWKLQWRI